MLRRAAAGLFLGAAGWVASIGICATPLAARQEAARISVERRELATYPFSEPNPVPILASDARLYPYHRFEGYAHDSEPREWTVVHLENDWIELWVLPEIGGKVWGARVKASGHEFVYRNEVVKFRNIALRGPWTSGGIEFNFGVIGHTPATATPVDWTTRENADGSVSVFVGATDLPSRTRWRVEIRLPADRAYFETNASWHNPTPLEQPYYNWMTGAAFARDDLVLSVPGTDYLGHPGERHAWPVDEAGRRLPVYDQNRFGANKSYHVVGVFDDFFGGYYTDDDWGFGHWARYEEMPGQKIWLWALSRQGGIWEDLLTDTDGQYVEFQAGRLLVQYSPTGDVNPISEAGFAPGATDRWTESWFPVEGLGGLTEASRDGALHVERVGARLDVSVHAFVAADDTLELLVDGRSQAAVPLRFEVLEPERRGFDVPEGAVVELRLPRLGLSWSSDPAARALARPWSSDAEAVQSIPALSRRLEEASELVQGRRLPEAARLYRAVLAEEPWNRDGLLGLAELEYRRGLHAEGMALAERALRLDAYDARANFVAGTLHRALGHELDAREAFGWSARSMAYRSVSYVQLAELALARGEALEAGRYARLALDYDRYSVSALRVAAVAARIAGDDARARAAREEIGRIDPLDHFVAAEAYLGGEPETGLQADLPEGHAPDRALAALESGLRGEYPEQEILELAIAYVGWGLEGDAARLLDASRWRGHPLVRAWWSVLTGTDVAVSGPADVAFVFPYRPETIPVLARVVAGEGSHWSWSYLLALNLWAVDRAEEAAAVLSGLGDAMDFAPAYVTRAALGLDPEADLRRAVELDPDARLLRIPLIRHLQSAGRWEDALAVSARARADFPTSFDLDLLHAAALVETMRQEEAIEVLAAVRVLPSEHSGTAHPLFAQAHTLAGLAALDAGDPDEAAEHFLTATTWPEHLGQGRPYEPEERLQRYLLGVALARDGHDPDARAAFETVLAATPDTVLDGGRAGRTDLLAAAALEALGRSRELARFGDGQEGAMGRLVGAVRRAAGGTSTLAEELREEAGASSSSFEDVEGRMLWRALTLER